MIEIVVFVLAKFVWLIQRIKNRNNVENVRPPVALADSELGLEVLNLRIEIEQMKQNEVELKTLIRLNEQQSLKQRDLMMENFQQKLEILRNDLKGDKESLESSVSCE